MRTSMRFSLLPAALMLVSASAFAATGDAMSFIPSDAATIGVVRLADIRNSPLLGRIIAETDKVSGDADAMKFMRDAGLKPTKDVDVMIVSSSGSEPDAKVLVAFDGRFDAARLASAAEGRGAVKRSFAGASYYVPSGKDGEKGAVAFLSNRLILAGDIASVKTALTLAANKGSNTLRPEIAREMARIDRNASAFAIIDLRRTGASFNQEKSSKSDRNDPRVMAAAAMKGVSLVSLWTRDTGTDLTMSGRAIANDNDIAQSLEDILRGMLAGWRMAIQEKAPELVSVLRKFEIDRAGNEVTFSGTLPGEMLKKHINASNHQHHTK